MSQPEALKTLLQAVAQGSLSPESALLELKHLNFEPVADFAKVDNHRHLRTGFPEVVWGPGKTPEQISQIMQTLAKNSPLVMATRIESVVAQNLQVEIEGLVYYPLARICVLQKGSLHTEVLGNIAIISAGTADIPVAEEAAVTAELCGFRVQRLWDVGVAGIHRLLLQRHLFTQAHVVIVVAGMEGALPSVVAGLVDCPVIAVPTSIGYGTNFAGVAPLLTMLNSCAVGIGVMNIDNGFGAAILAGQILRTAEKIYNSQDIDKNS
jgi:NCAIR mutase (PurE)-related protein